MAVAEQVLDLDDVHVGIEQQRGRGRPERVGRVDAAADVEPSWSCSSFMAPGSRSIYCWIRLYMAEASSGRLADFWRGGPKGRDYLPFSRGMSFTAGAAGIEFRYAHTSRTSASGITLAV